jgi:CRP-like cAMP-binding protein
MRAAQSAKTRYPRPPRVHRLFSLLPEAVTRELERKLIFARHGTGSVVYRQEEEAEGIFFVFEGRVKVSAIDTDTKTARC